MCLTISKIAKFLSNIFLIFFFYFAIYEISFDSFVKNSKILLYFSYNFCKTTFKYPFLIIPSIKKTTSPTISPLYRLMKRECGDDKKNVGLLMHDMMQNYVFLGNNNIPITTSHIHTWYFTSYLSFFAT